MHSCIKTIVDKYDSLTYSEKRFVDYVIQNKAQVIYMSIGQLAEAVEVAPIVFYWKLLLQFYDRLSNCFR